jgi:hypothetical protein
MAGVTHANLGYTSIDALLTTTLANYRKTLIDNIFDDYPLLSYMNGRLGRAVRGGSIKELKDGGESLIEHIMYEQNSTVDSYAGYELLDTTPQEGFTQARYTWKQYSTSISISGLEERSNRGEAAMINLLQAKTQQAEMSLRDRMSRDAFSDGTGNSSKNLGGLEIIIDSTGTLGGINQSTYSWWASTETSGGSFAARGVNDMRTTFNTVTFGNDKPDMIITTQTVHEFYEKSLQPQERFVDTKTADAGFMNLAFKGVPVIFDRDCTSGVMYFLNSRWLKFAVHRDADFVTSAFVRPENQDARTAQILFQGNMLTNNRRKLAKITGITA